MWISVVAAGEFEVGEPISDLPLQNFRIQPYNLPQAIRAADLYRALRAMQTEPTDDRRPIIINDVKIIAQAEEDNIPVILTEDANTLSRLASRLLQGHKISTRVILLSEGFTPGRLSNPAENELPFPPNRE